MFRLLLIFLIFIYNTDFSRGFDEGKCIPQTIKTCIDESEREIEGFKVKKCWKYKEILRCSGSEENNCKAFEGNRGCNEVRGVCLKKSPTGLCNDYEKIFTCGHKNIEETKEVKLITSEFNVLRDEKDLEGCSPFIKDKYCKISEESCIEPGEMRNINGKDIYKDCWRWDRKYTCRTDTKVDDCKEFREKGCIEKNKECLHKEDDRCEHFIVEYECKNKSNNKIDCVASNFCIGGICEEQERRPNNNFGLAASYLGVLSQVQKDGESCGCNKEKDANCKIQNIEGDKCKLFKGEKLVCKRITGEYNCCAGRGFIKPLIGCKDEEKELQSKQRAKLCTYVGSWKKGPLKLVQKKSHCCFNSSLARIIQEQGRAQLGISWGDKKNPDCRALTLKEIQRIDFSKIDFSEIYADFQAKAKSDFSFNDKDIAKKLKGYQDNPTGLKGMIKNKMQEFYGKQK